MNSPSQLPPRHTVFIVDDHPLIRRVLARFLNAEPGLEVVGEAESAETAQMALNDLTPDLVLVDFSLPGMDGAELIARLRVSQPQARYLMISSHDARRYADLSLAAGADGYVAKGDPDLLLRAIAKVLDGQTVVELG